MINSMLIVITVKTSREHIISMLLEELKAFCGETSIHGLGQIANDTASAVKRLLWLVTFIGSLFYAAQQLSLSFTGTLPQKNIRAVAIF